MLQIVEAGSKTRPELNAAIGNFVSERLWGVPGRIERFSSFGVFDDGTLIAGILWHNWQQDAGVVEISGAATDKRWLTRAALLTMFGVPFDRWGCQLVVMRVSVRDMNLPAMLRRFGFDEFRIPRLRGRGEDELILTLTDDRWRQHPLSQERKVSFGEIEPASSARPASHIRGGYWN